MPLLGSVRAKLLSDLTVRLGCLDAKAEPLSLLRNSAKIIWLAVILAAIDIARNVLQVVFAAMLIAHGFSQLYAPRSRVTPTEPVTGFGPTTQTVALYLQ